MSLPLSPLVGGDGGLVSQSVGKADLLSDYFHSRQSRESVDLLLTCHLSPRFTTFAFRSSEVKRLLLDLDPYGAVTHWVCFLFFLRELQMFWPPSPPCLNELFPRLVHLGSFPASWWQVNVTPIPKAPPPFSVDNYLPISITSVFSKVVERLVSVRLGRFKEHSGVLPNTQFAYRKELGTSDALLCMSYTLQSAF